MEVAGAVAERPGAEAEEEARAEAKVGPRERVPRTAAAMAAVERAEGRGVVAIAQV